MKLTFVLLVGLGLCHDMKKVVYYASWNEQPVDKIPYKGITHSNPKASDIKIKDGDDAKIRKMVTLANAEQVKALLSIGGWTGSQTFSDICADPILRQEFTNNAVALIKEYKLDGIDLDWEFPTKKGHNNTYRKSDSVSFIELANYMREEFDKEFNGTKLLTASVPAHPYLDANNKPISDLSKMAKGFHFVNIMAYSIMGDWSNSTGPNAPLYTTKETQYSLEQAITDWIAAKFPPNKLNAGFAFFGSIQRSRSVMTGDTIFSEADKSKNITTPPAILPCEEGAFNAHVFSYACLRKRILNSPNSVNPDSGFELYRDNVTRTPWLFHPETKYFISYDDPKSIAEKRRLAKRHKLLGVMLWDITQDHNNELLNAATKSTKC
ncbi:hypothetical protein L0F63_001181 [Massospora cicadina]|nr:hypothetical protein L0F63_001181 [Massospora cicadina]